VIQLVISILANSFFAVVQVKKAEKRVKVTSQKSQVPKPKKLATFRVTIQKVKVKKLPKARKSEKVTARLYTTSITAAKYSIVLKHVCNQAQDLAGLRLLTLTSMVFP